ncbi:putative F420-0 ABC transporter permease subunit [Nocardioides jishulii]|uniref:Iron ABC transporter permease n=1 Tax=Nocardioides jishulii TaxID=2575440 RepID=A0A4U2YSP9_9ACTN|nr:putative F420-0 ABC transporter permease subunit [Nocardioides jishulii]QCX26541.1 iron chelate uptake ABC transporter family permease subunit [Nocardioides jishulii]TKI63652.1 iron ABC transporter permease [Nocardioides jishulii]
MPLLSPAPSRASSPPVVRRTDHDDARFWVLWVPLLLGALLASVAVAVTIGAADLTVAEVWQVVGAKVGLVDSDVSLIRTGIVWELRLPRVLTAAAVGGGLALAGAVMQALTRNPLADPYLLGLSSGASTGAVLVLLLGVAAALPVAAFAGALAALVVTLLLARSLGEITPSRTVLAGLAVSSFAGALTSLLIFWNARGDSFRQVLNWILGSLAGADWGAVALTWTVLVVVGLPLARHGRVLDAFAFGDTAAAALGVDVGRTRWVLLVATALLTGAMVAVSGSIGFVGLVLPNAVRLVVGFDHRRLLPLSVLCGAIFMVWVDTAARTLFDPREIPVGIITVLVGAPVFVLVLLRHRGRA